MEHVVEDVLMVVQLKLFRSEVSPTSQQPAQHRQMSEERDREWLVCQCEDG